MNLFFIRHGETTGDVEGRYGGDYDDRLTEKGSRAAYPTAAG
jgi:broad specificity phosphatase PhoE